MVTKSTINYNQWKEEVRENYYRKFSKKRVDIFMNYVSKVYDDIGRVFFPAKVMWYLFDRKMGVMHKDQHFWIGAVGKTGGEGKSTFMKQLLHFCDPEFNADERTARDYDEFIRIVYRVKTKEKKPYPAILLDEQDPTIHTLSKEGRQQKKILSKIRKYNLIVGCCGNSMEEIPTFIFHRLSAVCYFNGRFRFNLWDQNKDPKGSIISDIRGSKGWGLYKHGVFSRHEFIKRAFLKNIGFSKELPFKELKYAAEKTEDLDKDITSYIKKDNKEGNLIKASNRDPRQRIDYLIMDSLIKNGVSNKEIMRQCGCSKVTVWQRKKKLKETSNKSSFSLENKGSEVSSV